MYTEYSPPEAQISLRFSLPPAIFEQKKPRSIFVEKRKCTELPQNDLQHFTVKSTMYTLNTHPMPKFHSVSLYVFQIFKVFGFPIGYIGDVQNSLKIKNSKFEKQNKKKQYFCEDQWEEN